MATYGTFVDGVSLKAAEANDFLSWVSFTPSATQGGAAIGVDVAIGRYAVVNKLVMCHFVIDFNGTGVAGNRIEVTLPITALSSSARVIGTGYFWDASATDIIRAVPLQYSTTKVAFLTNTGTSLTSYLGTTNGPAVTIADNDFLSALIFYEAA
jgi:hypothetical protein